MIRARIPASTARLLRSTSHPAAELESLSFTIWDQPLHKRRDSLFSKTGSAGSLSCPAWDEPPNLKRRDSLFSRTDSLASRRGSLFERTDSIASNARTSTFFNPSLPSSPMFSPISPFEATKSPPLLYWGRSEGSRSKTTSEL
jgi:hypothetical protein